MMIARNDVQRSIGDALIILIIPKGYLRDEPKIVDTINYYAVGG